MEEISKSMKNIGLNESSIISSDESLPLAYQPDKELLKECKYLSSLY